MDKSKIERTKNFLLGSLGFSTKLRKPIQILWKEMFIQSVPETSSSIEK